MYGGRWSGSWAEAVTTNLEARHSREKEAGDGGAETE